MDNIETRKEIIMFAMRVIGHIFNRANRRMHMRYQHFLKHRHLHENKTETEYPKRTPRLKTVTPGRPITRSIAGNGRPVTRSVTALQNATGVKRHIQLTPTLPRRRRQQPTASRIVPWSIDHPERHPNCEYCVDFLRFLDREKKRSRRTVPVLHGVVRALVTS